MGSAADDELLAAATVAKSSRQMLAVGDLVKVTDGDLKNLMGKVHSVSVDGNMVTIMPKHDMLKEPLSFQAELLVKWFKMGDHIKIVGGTRHVGETGMVVKVGNGADDEAEASEKQKSKRTTSATMLTIFSDMTESEIQVSAAFVQECAEVSQGLETLGAYSLHDLVMLDRTSVGCIVKVEHSSFKLLSTSGELLTVELPQMEPSPSPSPSPSPLTLTPHPHPTPNPNPDPNTNPDPHP